MRLLLYNPNTNAELTLRLARAARPHLAAADTLEVATASQVPQFLGSEDSIADARVRLNADLPAAAQQHDAVLLGCFGDLGIESLRARLRKPVVSLWDACVFAARRRPMKMGIVTTSPFWAERLRRDVRLAGLDERISAIAAIPIAPRFEDNIAALERAIHELADLRAVDHVVLGGALLATLISEIEPSPLPLIDTLGLAVGLCRRSVKA